jgi:sec-independent protein translocase protein TatA
VEFPGGWELILILVVVMLVFGYKRLPDATRSIGRSMRIFKAEVKGLKDDDEPASPMSTPPTTSTVAEVTPVLPPVVNEAAPAQPVVQPTAVPAPQAPAPSRQP